MRSTAQRELARAIDPWSGSGVRHLVRALGAVERDGTMEATRLRWQLEQRVLELVRCAKRVRRSDVAEAVRRTSKKCRLALPTLGLDTTDSFPTPRTLVRVARTLYPPKTHPRVLDVAGGASPVATAFARAGYDVTTIDPHGKRRKGIRFMKRRFLVRDAEGYDLLLAFRPCAASRKVVRASRSLPTIMIPCMCRSVWPKSDVPYRACAAYFRQLGIPFRRLGLVFLTGDAALKRGARAELRMAGGAA